MIVIKIKKILYNVFNKEENYIVFYNLLDTGFFTRVEKNSWVKINYNLLGFNTRDVSFHTNLIFNVTEDYIKFK